MASENTATELVQRLERRSSQSVFQREEGLRLLCYPVPPVQQLQAVSDSSPRTRQLSGFIDIVRERSCQTEETENRRELYIDAAVQRDCVANGNLIKSGSGGDLAEEVDYEDEDDEDQEDERLNDGNRSTKKFKSCGDRFNNPGQINKGGLKHDATPGVSLNVNYHQGKDYQFQNVLPISSISGDSHCARVLNVSEKTAPQRRDVLTRDNGSASTLWKVTEPPLYESVRSILSDPFTGELMDDAILFPCGHSFGAGGLQQCLQKKACYICSLRITEESVHRNLTLRAAVAAFRREEYENRSLKRRRDGFEEKADFNNSNYMDSSRIRSLQFPFAVTDRVMIVGNKRTPLRFVGREAIITSQCLNGWYVVKTLDNGESVKLQYRSLAKVL